MKPNLKDAKVVAFLERGITSWNLASREERGKPFRIRFTTLHIQPDDFYQNLYPDVVVVEEFPSVRSVVDGAPAFIGKDRVSNVVRVWARREDGLWGAVNLSSDITLAYPATAYSTDTLGGIVDIDSIVVLREV